jgi:4-hydroxyphenylacetate 3-monooxygenase
MYEMVEIARELGGGQVCLTPDAASFAHEDTRPWLDKYYTINENWIAEDRRKLLAFSRDLLNSDYAGHRLTFQEFAQSPRFAHLASVYHNFDWSGPAEMARQAAGISDQVIQPTTTQVSGQGGFLGTRAAAVKNRRAQYANA